MSTEFKTQFTDDIDIVLVKEALVEPEERTTQSMDLEEENRVLRGLNKEYRKGLKRLFMLLESKKIEVPIYLLALYESYKEGDL